MRPRLAPPLLPLLLAPWLLVPAGCATVPAARQASLVPTRHSLRVGPYAIATNAPLPADDPAVRQLVALEGQVRHTLGLDWTAARDPIEIYILDDREAFNHFLTYYYADLPPRRAFFFAQGPRRVVYTFRGRRLEEDLRHEATHALLHTAADGLPLWLDEGLAEYFEGPADDGGLNPEHLGRLRAELAQGWTPDLARLESLDDVRRMTPRDYREAWAWVHYLLHGPAPGRAALLGYLADLGNGQEPGPLSRHLAGVPDLAPALVAHLERAQRPPLAGASPRPEAPTYRLQDAPASPPGRRAEPPRTPGRRTLGRVLDLLARPFRRP